MLAAPLKSEEQSTDSHESESQTIFLIKPKMDGFANDLQVMTEDGRVIYHVKARIFAQGGHSFAIYDENMQEYLSTRQQFTALFPRHDVMHSGVKVAEVGQQRIVPMEYFIQFHNGPRMRIGMGIYSSICQLVEVETNSMVAEVGFERSTWVVALSNDREPSDILPLLSIIYRQNTIGG